jgi:hypothetical protein
MEPVIIIEQIKLAKCILTTPPPLFPSSVCISDDIGGCPWDAS